jgi:hypothetical protein
MATNLIPAQEKGKSLDLQEEVISEEVGAAKEIFQRAVERLSHPTSWHETAGTLSASFSIDGKNPGEAVQQGDHLRIAIPGPGLSEGDGEDWVRVEAIQKNFDSQYDESFGILVMVCPNPHTKGDAVAHLFAEGASSTFLITRKGKTVTAQYKGRNELPNTEDLTVTDKVRNLVVAGGALAGISDLQWSALLKGLLSTDEK